VGLQVATTWWKSPSNRPTVVTRSSSGRSVDVSSVVHTRSSPINSNE
jgi:hypothetical protein